MSAENDDQAVFFGPWKIEFLQGDNQIVFDPINNVTAQAGKLTINDQPASAEFETSCRWSKHERLTGEILNQAAQRAAAETFKNISVYHPTQSHKPSEDTPGKGIRSDYIIAWSYDGVRKNTMVVDAKDHQTSVPRREYEKICRDMREIKATRGILLLGPDATIGDKLRTEIEKDNKVDIVQIKDGQANVVRAVAQHIGRMVDKDFVPNENRWEQYGPFVTSDENRQERRPNRHGEKDTYTCDSTYHRFHHPRKQDGTVDERFEANQDRNKDGGPDMRMVGNKSKQAQEQHLNEDGSDDMRSKEHREQLVDGTGHRLNVDGTPDMRCQESATGVPSTTTTDADNDQRTAIGDMRLAENRQNMIDDKGYHLNVDGSPDIRYKENQTGTNQTVQEEINETASTIPTKTDGTADMRFKESKDAVALGTIEPDQQLTGEQATIAAGDNEGILGSASADVPTKSDGTADMRYNASQDAVASGEISRDEVLSGGGESAVSSGMMDSVGGGDGGGDGPLKADGTADMRFSANQ